MKSNDMKVLCDDNGNKYRFSAEKFKLALSNKKEKDKNNGIKTYSATLKRAIADRSGLSEEAVKKWEMGHNGPSNIDQVRIAADVLDIPYTALIDQVKKTGEINTVGERNKQLIDTIFRESLAILIQKAKYKPDGEDGKERNAQYRRNQKNTSEGKVLATVSERPRSFCTKLDAAPTRSTKPIVKKQNITEMTASCFDFIIY